MVGCSPSIRRLSTGVGNVALRGVLFDLDGTLLDLDLGAFLRRYFGALDAVIRANFHATDAMPAIMAATAAMQRLHPGRTNREVFNEDVFARTGIDLATSWGVFDEFYRDVFPTLGSGCRPVPGAREAVQQALRLGLRVAVATQPIFPRAAIDHRIAWAGLSDLPFDVVTTYEIMRSCKPHASYFEETAGMLGCAPAECLMVGDDRGLDLPAAATGMRTFFVGDDPAAQPDFAGSLTDLAALLERL
jgi:FMN phosphatase YigB (HAD superfamily)